MRRAGFTLIELLIVVAIIGIIVAIAIPNLLTAIQRAKQRRTMGDIRSIATAVESYSVDMGRYPPSAGAAIPWTIATSNTVGNQLIQYLTPTYFTSMPLADGWNSWLTYGNDATQMHYFIQSTGRDGVMDPGMTVTQGPTTNFNDDIIFADGQFTRYPDGVQQN